MENFPAILIGGPPHSGKSVLTYSLTSALRERGIDHYVIRATPDGEGDWANEADQGLVRALRYKGAFTPEFVDFVCRSLANRHLPLLVDVGGKPTPEQERIFDHCTHAILLTPDAESLDRWRALVAGHALIKLAELTSLQTGAGEITASAPLLRGVLTGLERGQRAQGPAFEALVERLESLFDQDADELFRIHESARPEEIDTVVNLYHLARSLGAETEAQQPHWEPHHLPALLDYLPEATPLALYGRGPNWTYAAVALATLPAPFYQFDPRLGWVRARRIHIGERNASPVTVQRLPHEDFTHMEFCIPCAHVEYDELETFHTPPVPGARGLVLSGKIPQWLYTSLAWTYRPEVPWLAVYQPKLKGAVVVHSATRERALGDCIPIPPANRPSGG